MERRNCLQKSSRERSVEKRRTFAQRLKCKACPEERNELPSSSQWTQEGLKLITFWFLLLVFSAAGWWLLFSRVIPSIVHWFYH